MTARRMLTPLARARGLGSARSGSGHWWAQRVTALALAPLTLWFIASFALLIGADHAAYIAWLGAPLNAVLMIAFVLVSFLHMALGLQVIVEDYVHADRMKIALVIGIQLACMLLAITGLVTILKTAPIPYKTTNTRMLSMIRENVSFQVGFWAVDADDAVADLHALDQGS